MKKHIFLFLTAAALLLEACFAQSTTPTRKSSGNPAAGTWEGKAKGTQQEIPLTMELKADGAKMLGEIRTPQGAYSVTGGSYAKGKLSLDFKNNEAAGKLSATIKQNKMSGEWTFGTDSGTFECARSAAAAKPAPPAPQPAKKQ
jgi:hypothetical protein